ncbi:Metal-dependent hydrolases of the beta-lactamase superfamily II [Dissulfuribacter thermophilus]|uniref:Metal-dependent hydrolases of the beta-lactamase superfamily II n=1 Tax=Dissulfuribacter thermophilus TaxID=1156395 RepID=A0A1B9F5H9_9BACT|nr:MBL fold metallo-hydrolase [Dissulfuribacter thermophilus]OCC15176.1 Metal-dependent hydrolases of the beta-lactamase superfamily II [Dissulfuribacter thermophilus]
MIKITALVDDKTGRLKGGHGLSLWIDAFGQGILFDLGQGDVLLDNAKCLGIPIEDADIVVLSHGHYDHLGPLSYCLTQLEKARFFVNPNALKPKFCKKAGKITGIGIYVKNFHNKKVQWVDRPTWIFEDKVGVTGKISLRNKFEMENENFFLDPDGLIQDPFEDEQCMWINTASGLIIFLGCSHRGVINSISTVIDFVGKDEISYLIGGFHLISATKQKILNLINGLRDFKIEHIVPIHCTGQTAKTMLRAEFGNAFIDFSCGDTLICQE